MTIHATFGASNGLLDPIKALLNAAPDIPQTDLCRAMSKHGSDKGEGRHNYTPFYEALRGHRDTTSYVFELGIGSINPFQNAMGAHLKARPDYKPGASLRGWRDYYPNAQVVGADIDPEALFEEDRITTFQVDATNAQSTAAMWNNVKARHGDIRFDLMVDDGLHIFNVNWRFLSHSKHMLAPGGLYIIEDIQLTPVNVAQFDGFLSFVGWEGAIVEVPHRWNHEDNCFAVLRAPL